MKAALILLILVVGLVSAGIVKNRRIPKGLGGADGLLAPLPKTPNGVSSRSADAGKRVDPLPYLSNRDEAKEAVKAALRAYGGIELVREEEDYLHAVSRTPVMRFRDDLEFSFDDTNGVVHFRSVSRVGYSDMGLNRKRYDRLVELYR